MKKYNKRKNKLFREIDLLNVHLCDKTCEYTTYQVGEFIYFIINDLEDGKCDKFNTLSKEVININNFNINKPKTILNDLLFNDEIILPSKFDVHINFPINNTSTFTVNNHNKKTTLGDLICHIKRIYNFIYSEELNTCTTTKYTFLEKCKNCTFKQVKDMIDDMECLTEKECIICMNNDKQSIKLSCGHVMHKECILDWVKYNNNTCPICRDYIRKCNICKGKMEIETDYEAKVIPMEHRSDFIRNTTDGIFGIHTMDLENLFLRRIFYDFTNNTVYLKF